MWPSDQKLLVCQIPMRKRISAGCVLCPSCPKSLSTLLEDSRWLDSRRTYLYLSWSKAWDRLKGQRGLSVIAMPNYHFTAVWNSAHSRWRLSLTEGLTESQAAACGEETDSRHALLGNETLSCNSHLQFCQTGLSGATHRQFDQMLSHHQRRQAH